jgi:hypothetical protein
MGYVYGVVGVVAGTALGLLPVASLAGGRR